MINTTCVFFGGVIGALTTTKLTLPRIIERMKKIIKENSNIKIELTGLSLKNLTKPTVKATDTKKIEKILEGALIACAQTCAAVCLGMLFGSCITHTLLQTASKIGK